MLRVCFNGALFQTQISIFLKHYYQYSTTGKIPNSMVDFMVKSLGFSEQEAITAWSKVNSSKFINSKQKPNLVINFFKQRGLNNTQIKKLISCRPYLLRCNVDKTLIPKFNALQELGIFGTDFAHIVASNASILNRGLSSRIAPMINFLRLNYGCNDKILKVLRRASWLLSADVVTKLQPNIDVLRKYGLSDKRILNLISHHGQVFVHDPKRLEEIVVKVNDELGVPFDSATFPDAVVLIASFGDENREAKCKIFRRYGWSDMDIMVMFRKSPRLMAFSEESLCERLEFFVNELGFKPDCLAKTPYAMTYSMKDRILPRYALLQGLKERKIKTAEVSILTAMCNSEAVFLKKFVVPYEDKVPELCEAYTCRVKRTRASQI